MQHILVKAAIPIHAKEPDTIHTYAKRIFNRKSGYGRIDGVKLLQVARSHRLVGRHTNYTFPLRAINKTIPVNGIGLRSTITVTKFSSKPSNLAHLEHVHVNITFRRRNEIELNLISPARIVSPLIVPLPQDNVTHGVLDMPITTLIHW